MDNIYRISTPEKELLNTNYMVFSLLNNHVVDGYSIVLCKASRVSYINNPKLRSGADINISYRIDDKDVYEFDRYVIDVVHEYPYHDNFIITVKVPYYPDLPLVTVLSEWVRGNDLMYWKHNNYCEAKLLWLHACFYWCQLFPPVNSGVIDVSLNSENLRNYNDFFCMPGEAFWGRRGYIGKGFDSFDDCLYELRKGDVIINIRKIKEVEPFLIGISPPGINYKEIFEDVLRDNNCNIID